MKHDKFRTIEHTNDFQPPPPPLSLPLSPAYQPHHTNHSPPPTYIKTPPNASEAIHQLNQPPPRKNTPSVPDSRLPTLLAREKKNKEKN